MNLHENYTKITRKLHENYTKMAQKSRFSALFTPHRTISRKLAKKREKLRENYTKNARKLHEIKS